MPPLSSARCSRRSGPAEPLGSARTRITALATYGTLGSLPDDVRTTATEPELPPLEACLPSSMAPEDVRRIAPLMSRFDLRIDPAYAGWAVGRPSGSGIIQAWFKLTDGREPDPISLLMTVDALPPVTFDLGMPGWAPRAGSWPGRPARSERGRLPRRRSSQSSP